MPDLQRKTGRLGYRPALDGLRAIAVALVVGIHVGLIPGGYVGVDVFLVLSGFLITTLLVEEQAASGRISLPRFLERRARRLLPALLVLLASFTALMLTLHPFHPAWPLGRLDLVTAGFATNWITALDPLRGRALGPLSPTWTLAQEGQFYLLWPPALWLLVRRGAGVGTLLATVAAAIAVLLGTVPLIVHLDPAYNTYTNPLARAAELLLGSAVGLLWRERRLPRLLTRQATGWVAAILLALVVELGTVARPGWYLAAACLGALLIVSLLGTDTAASGAGAGPLTGAGNLLRRALAWRPLAFVGKISYAIYLFHLPIFYLLERYAPLPSRAAYWGAVLILAVALAAASWRWVESPILRRGRRRGSRSRPSGRLLTRTRRIAGALPN